jgi:hypothetical protein
VTQCWNVCPVSAARWADSAAAARRCDLAAAELELGEQAQRKGQDSLGASRSCRIDNAVEPLRAYAHCSIHTSDWAVQSITNESSLSGSMDSSDSNNDSTSAQDP